MLIRHSKCYDDTEGINNFFEESKKGFINELTFDLIVKDTRGRSQKVEKEWELNQKPLAKRGKGTHSAMKHELLF